MGDLSLLSRILIPPLSKAEAFRKSLYPKARIWKTMVEWELPSGLAVPVSLRRRLWLWRRGFCSQSAVLFDFDEYDYRYYLSDYGQILTGRINGSWNEALNNKFATHQLLQPFSAYLPELYGIITDDRMAYEPESIEGEPLGGPATETASQSGVSVSDAFELIDTSLRENESVVLKPIYGTQGDGVMMCSFEDGEYHLDGERVARNELVDTVSALEEYLVYERIEQADYAKQLFPDTVNTIRLTTMWDYEENEPFIAESVHRIGVDDSIPVDNFSKSGIAAKVDVETGAVSDGVRKCSEPNLSLEHHRCHPDTDERIAGTQVPNWSIVRDSVLELARYFSFAPFLGWDIVVTEGGFSIIEINPEPGLFQELEPIKVDPRARRFLERHDCVQNRFPIETAT